MRAIIVRDNKVHVVSAPVRAVGIHVKNVQIGIADLETLILLAVSSRDCGIPVQTKAGLKRLGRYGLIGVIEKRVVCWHAL